MSFDLLATEVENGLQGKNTGIPMGFDRLNRYIGIRKRIYTLIFGATGTGKSSLCYNAFILNPFDWYIKTNPDNLKIKFILFSMERSKIYTLAKWVSRRIFLDEATLIPIPRLLGWWTGQKLSKDEHDLFLSYKGYIDELCTYCDIVESGHNPTGIYKYLRKYAEANGRFEQIDEYHKIYIPTHPNEIVIPIIDHIGLTKPEKGMNKKEAIDKVSEHMQWARDALGYSPVVVSQINRDLSNPIYQKLDSFEPNLDQVKESGRMSEDCDSAISLFQPSRYKTNDIYYKVENFISPEGADYFRSVKILKNSYGESDVKCGMGFMGSIGDFKELPRPKEMEGFDYQTLFNNSFFLKNN